MFIVDQFELTWVVGGVRHALRVEKDGRGTLVEAGEQAPLPPEALEGVAARPKQGRAGMRWTPEEDAVIDAAFDTAESMASVARRIGRSVGAVRARLVFLGRIDESEAGLRFPVSRPPKPAAVREEPAD